MSDFDPFSSPFQPGSGCDPFDDFDCPQGIYEPPLVISNTTITIVNDNAAALGSVQKAVDSLDDSQNKVIKWLGSLWAWLLLLLGLLKTLWEKHIKPLAKQIGDGIDKLAKKIDKILKPIMDALKAQRQALMDLYTKFIRPLIMFIESFRRFIRVLQLFHVHLFDKLDAQLAKLEAKIMGPFLAALGRINTLGNWISFILNARLLIFRGLFLGSMDFNKGGAFTLLAGTPGYGLPLLPNAGPTQPTKPDPPPTYSQTIAAVDGRLPALAASYGSGPAHDLVQCWLTPIENVEIKGATADLVTCLFKAAGLPSPL